MGGIRHRIGLICPFTRHTESATLDNRETEMIAVRPLLGGNAGMALSAKGMKWMCDLNEVRKLVEPQCS